MVAATYPLRKFVAATYPLALFVTFIQPDIGFENSYSITSLIWINEYLLPRYLLPRYLLPREVDNVYFRQFLTFSSDFSGHFWLNIDKKWLNIIPTIVFEPNTTY